MLDGAVSGLLTRLTQLDPALAALVTRIASLAATVVALLIAYRLIVRVVDRVTARREISTPRVRTVGVLLTNLARWLLAFILLVVVLTEFGIDVRALLVSAGLVGLAIGFGAQTLVRDLISGLFLLFEGLVSVGDVVEIGGHRGTVETIGLRVTRLRQDDGAIRVVPNGLLNDFVNLSVGFARATVDVTVGHAADLPRALAALRATAEGWAEDTGAALAPPEVPGIMRITGGDVVLRVSVKVDPARRVTAEFELRRRIKEAFDRERIPLVATS